jgi:branched-chain amino acid transport system ATP-binding protein
MLKVTNLNTHYGSVHALKGVDFEINEGEVVSIIGSNGAGKTSLLNSILGVVKPSSGNAVFLDQDITSLPCHKTINLGISVVPEAKEVFTSFTVYENIRMGLKKDIHRYSKNEFGKELDSLFEIFPRLKERLHQVAGTLSGGEQQMLVISRALVSKPKLLMLDEPSLGLAPIIVNEIFNIIKRLKEGGMTIILVEQIANKALKVADRGYVIENGKIVMSGTGEELRNNKDIAKAYLGV